MGSRTSGFARKDSAPFAAASSYRPCAVTDKDVRESIAQAIDLIGRAEEGVQRVREEAQKRRSQEEAMEAFDGLCGYVCAGTLDGGLGWAQKAAAVRECFEDEKVVNTCMARGAALWPLDGQTCSYPCRLRTLSAC